MEEHVQRIMDLATRLRQDGVDVTIDRWDLKEGHDKYAFMERMVTDPSIQKVLVVCDKMYAEKADARRGGVGTETQIISQEIYQQVQQDNSYLSFCKEMRRASRTCGVPAESDVLRFF
jgi:hypothetical protein